MNNNSSLTVIPKSLRFDLWLQFSTFHISECFNVSFKDVSDHPPIRRKSGASVQQPSSHGDTRGDTKAAIKLELVPGVEKTSKLESMTSEPQQTKTG